MSSHRINEQILEALRENSNGDKAIADFLIDLIYEEAEHPGQWRYKEVYRKKIKEYSEKWSSGDED